LLVCSSSLLHISIANGKIPEGEDEEAAMKWLF
jgi:hypothetical protein